MRAVNVSAWHRKVQYRWRCDGCGELHLCAVITRRGGRRTLRLCQGCYGDGHWRKEG